MAFITQNPVKVLDHIHMTRIGFGENPIEDAILMSLKDLNNPGVGAASYQFTPKMIARRIDATAHKTFAARTIDMVLEDVKIKPILVATRTSNTVFDVASTAVAATLVPGMQLIYANPNTGAPAQSAVIDTISSTTITFIAPGITNYATGDQFLIGSFSKAAGADRAAGGFRNPLVENTNYVQFDVRKVTFTADELNQDELYKPRTEEVILNKFDDTARAMKFGSLLSFYTGKKATFNDDTGKTNYSAGWYMNFLSNSQINYINSGTKEARRRQLHDVISKVKRSGLQNANIVYLCTNKFRDELLNLYEGNINQTIQPSDTFKFRGIDANFEIYRVSGFSMELGASSVMDEIFPNCAVAIPVSLNHTSIYSLPYIRVDTNLTLNLGKPNRWSCYWLHRTLYGLCLVMDLQSDCYWFYAVHLPFF